MLKTEMEFGLRSFLDMGQNYIVVVVVVVGGGGGGGGARCFGTCFSSNNSTLVCVCNIHFQYFYMFATLHPSAKWRQNRKRCQATSETHMLLVTSFATKLPTKNHGGRLGPKNVMSYSVYLRNYKRRSESGFVVGPLRARRPFLSARSDFEPQLRFQNL